MTRTMPEKTIAPSKADRMYFGAITEQFRIRELIKTLESKSETLAYRENLMEDLKNNVDWCKKLDTRRFEKDEN